MIRSGIHQPPSPLAAPVAHATVEEQAAWLAAGWRDLRRAPAISLSYGAAFTVIGLVLVFGLEWAGLGSLILPLAAGFMLVGPLVAVGLYEISRRLETGAPVNLAAAVLAFRRNGDQIALMGVVLLVAMFAWIQVALILFAMFFEGSPPTLAAFADDLLASSDNLPFLLAGTVAGGILAAVVFAISVVSLPMLLDRPVTVAAAIATSIAVVRANPMAMIGWAATIAVIVGMGLATFLVGLAVALPLVGHASWHAYRALVR